MLGGVLARTGVAWSSYNGREDLSRQEAKLKRANCVETGESLGASGMSRPPRINYNMIYVYKMIFVPVSRCRGQEEDITPGKSRKFQVTAVFKMYLSVRLVALQLAGTFYLRHRV